MKKQITLNVFINLWQKAEGLAFCMILFSFIAGSTGVYGKTVVINEIAPSNSTLPNLDNNGKSDDWIELYNTTSSAINLSGYFLSDNATDLKKFKFPNVSIPANGYLIVWAVGETLQGGIQAPFKLSSEGETVYLSNSASQIIDKVTFGFGTGDMSYSRLPDGADTFVWQSFTQKATNSNGTVDDYKYNLNTNGIVINEYSPLNTSIADQDGEFDDWIELYNNSSSSVSLLGYYLSDNTSNPRLWAFPDTSIAPGGYIIVWADNDDDIGQAGLHAHFQLSSKGESLLLTNQTTVIGRTSYDSAFSNKSYARLPNGKGEYALQAPSFNVSNGNSSFTENLTTAGLVINEIVADNQTVKTEQSSGTYEDYIELFNNSASQINLSNYYVSDDPSNPSKWPIPDGTIIPAGGYLIVWADENVDAYTDNKYTHASFRLDANGETVLLTNGTKIIDKVTYGHANADLGYSRVPNGVGNFYWQAATFRSTNGTTIPVSEEIITDTPEQEFVVSHNRNNQLLTVSLGNDETKKITVYSITAAVQYSGVINGSISIPTSDWKNGVYLISIGNKEKVKKVVILK
ncbi:MAG: lamin tail domain-containing protein [Bacteroidales bacterium]|nr:lamin tail domain-containing protein [Bacteroidales bacterium]MDD4822179.1 lamin tail domain-containing protein [Bacteroidales bacterium]